MKSTILNRQIENTRIKFAIKCQLIYSNLSEINILPLQRTPRKK